MENSENKGRSFPMSSRLNSCINNKAIVSIYILYRSENSNKHRAETGRQIVFLTLLNTKFICMRFLYLTLPVLFVIASSQLSAQTAYFVVGYNLGAYVVAQPDLENRSVQWKEDLNMDFNVPNFNRGIALGFRLSDDNWFGEIMFSNKRMYSGKTTYIHPTSGEEQTYKLRFKLRTVNTGVAFGSPYLKFGASIDVGVIGADEKNAPTEEFNKEKWNNVYPKVLVKGDIYGGNTLFFSYTPFVDNINFQIEIRPYFQFSWFKLSNSDTQFSGGNYGVNINILFGG